MLKAYHLDSATICIPAPGFEAGLPVTALELVEVGTAASLDGLTQTLPGGAYTTLRTFHGCQALHLESHFQRLEETAAMLAKPLYLDRERLRQVLRIALREAQAPLPTSLGGEAAPADFRIRLVLDLEVQPGDLYLALQPLDLPPNAAYQSGVAAITIHMQRLLPKAKLTRFIERSSPVRQALPEGVNEALMLDDNAYLLEGLSSNFFAVIEGEIWTAEQGVLSGITRSLVLDGVQRMGIPLHLEPVNLAELPRLQEAFITSSSRAVLPLKQVDERYLPKAPGPLTRMLMEDYARSLEMLLEDI